MEQSYLDSFGCVKQCWISQYLSITSFEKKKKKESKSLHKHFEEI